MVRKISLSTKSLRKAGPLVGDALALCMLLESAGMGARLVGGCVRDLLLKKEPKDFDIACSAPPELSLALLKRAGFKVLEIGIEHGTIRVETRQQWVEITSLRTDEETDGRRAVVAYTDDFSLDASRRDFTINALYLDSEGWIWDYVDGLKDLKEKRLRFVGEANQRIREDYLRSLRYFRFLARLGWNADGEALEAIRQNQEGLRQLSQERVLQEMQGILQGKQQVLGLMLETGVLTLLYPWLEPMRMMAIASASKRLLDFGLEGAWWAFFRFGACEPWNSKTLETEMRRLRFDRGRIRLFTALNRLLESDPNQPAFWLEGLALLESDARQWLEVLPEFAPELPEAIRIALARLRTLAQASKDKTMPKIPLEVLETVPPKERAQALAIARLYFFSLGLEDLAFLQRIIGESSRAWSFFLANEQELSNYFRT